MECPFQVGDVVVCIHEKWQNEGQPLYTSIRFPQLNEVLTIREIRLSVTQPFVGTPCLLFNEIRNPLLPSHTHEIAFAYNRFRPAKKTDISVFTAMLKTKELTNV